MISTGRASAVARFVLPAVLLQAVAWPSLAADPTSGADAPTRFLVERLPLTGAEVREADRGRPVARTLRTDDGGEVATVGIVAAAVPGRFYMDQLRNIASFKGASRDVLQIGTFSVPATVADLAGLSLDADDLQDLVRCRLHACGIQLSGDGIERVGRAIAGSDASGAQRRGDRAFREILVDLVNRYRERGDAALMTYEDTPQPVSVAAEFRRMIGSEPAILKRLPALSTHMAAFPRPASRVDDVVYWSKEKLGPAVVVTVTHLAIAELDGAGPDAFAAASKQIYASHYFDASLGVTVLVGGAPEGRPRSRLVYANRSRIDALAGFWGGLKRAVVRSRTRSGLRNSLAEARALVERRFESRTTESTELR